MSGPVDLLFEGIGRGVSALAAAADPDLPELLRESEGRRLALVVRGSERCLEIEVREGALRVLPPRRPAPGGGYATGPVPREEEEGDGPVAAGGRPEGAGPSSSVEARSPGPPRDGGGGETAAFAPRTGRPEDPPSGADLVLAGSVPDFLRFLRAIRREPLRGEPFGGLEVHGGPDARAGFLQLLRRIDPDYEALLARAAGGVVAHAVSRTTIGRLFQARQSAVRLVDDLAEYLEEEARVVPDQPARARFAGGVRALIDKVAELEERLDRAR